jgi:hypothetical protein
MTRLFALQRESAGNTLQEYVLVGVVLCLGCIGLLMAFSQDFAAKMTGLKTELRQHGQKAALAQQQAHSMQNVRQVLQAADGANGLTTIHAGDAAVLTAGSNGDKKHADTISDGLIGSISTENLSPAQQDAFQTLANQAHKIAQMEALIESAANTSGGDVQKFRNMRINFNGDASYSVYYLSSSMYSKELQNFDAMKVKLLQSGALSTDALTYLNSLVNDVQMRAASVDSLTHLNDTSGISSLNASTNTHHDGQQICTTGQHQDEGKQCE